MPKGEKFRIVYFCLAAFVIGAASGALAGDLVAGASDMDGDGDAELLVYSRGWNTGGTGYGEVSLFTGGEW